TANELKKTKHSNYGGWRLNIFLKGNGKLIAANNKIQLSPLEIHIYKSIHQPRNLAQ
ncbi:1747_t:CDS:2, partial [Funneliformis caledonium]